MSQIIENLEKVEVKKEIYPPVTRKQALELLKGFGLPFRKQVMRDGKNQFKS